MREEGVAKAQPLQRSMYAKRVLLHLSKLLIGYLPDTLWIHRYTQCERRCVWVHSAIH